MIYNYEKAFEFLYDGVVYGQGGDGNGILYVKYDPYKEVAQEFEKFLKTKPGDWLKQEKEDYDIFLHGYEYFVIKNYDITRKIDENNDVVIIF